MKYSVLKYSVFIVLVILSVCIWLLWLTTDKGESVENKAKGPLQLTTVLDEQQPASLAENNGSSSSDENSEVDSQLVVSCSYSCTKGLLKKMALDGFLSNEEIRMISHDRDTLRQVLMKNPNLIEKLGAKAVESDLSISQQIFYVVDMVPASDLAFIGWNLSESDTIKDRRTGIKLLSYAYAKPFAYDTDTEHLKIEKNLVSTITNEEDPLLQYIAFEAIYNAGRIKLDKPAIAALSKMIKSTNDIEIKALTMDMISIQGGMTPEYFSTLEWALASSEPELQSQVVSSIENLVKFSRSDQAEVDAFISPLFNQLQDIVEQGQADKRVLRKANKLLLEMRE